MLSICIQTVRMLDRVAPHSKTYFGWLQMLTTLYVFNKSMEKIHKHNLVVVEYLSNVLEHWIRHTFDPQVCCDHNTTNF